MLPLIPPSLLAFYQGACLLFAAAAPVSVLLSELNSAYDIYGMGLFFLLAAWFFYKRTNKLENQREKIDALREKEHQAHIKALNDELKRERANTRD